MNNNVSIQVKYGLGDKMLDIIGCCVLTKYLNYKPHVTFRNDMQFAWGVNSYDMRLFEFNGVTLSDAKCDFFVDSPNPSSSLCPYKVYEFLSRFFPDLTFEQVSNEFVEASKQIIKPSELISSKIPKNIERAYGIHLRKTDKVTNWCDIRHENPIHEFNIIINNLLEDVHKIIVAEEEPAFLLVSEDTTWRQEIINIMLNISSKCNKPIQIIEVDYANEHNYCNYSSVLDMFCLSRCKEILQGVKYSTFSILASLLGSNKLRNYAHHTKSYDICLIHSWSSVVDINNNKPNLDMELHKKVTASVTSINTNIGGVFR